MYLKNPCHRKIISLCTIQTMIYKFHNSLANVAKHKCKWLKWILEFCPLCRLCISVPRYKNSLLYNLQNHPTFWAGSDTAIDKLYPDRQYISSSQQNWTFCWPVLGSRHCTVLAIYWNSWSSPLAQHPSSTAGVSKDQYEGRRAPPPSPFPSCCTYSMPARMPDHGIMWYDFAWFWLVCYL